MHHKVGKENRGEGKKEGKKRKPIFEKMGRNPESISFVY